ncbi:MAG: fumarylacetoacetate hydrolase family protein [Dehalococcoidaceae bacterium]|nr:fumarylacetoacetate hydrolase family protein [Dehalococcoidaceae bacterium]
MKIVRYTHNNNSSYGIVEGDTVKPIIGQPYKEIETGDACLPVSRVKLLAPCQPTKIIAMGLNYHSHAREMGHKIPNSPLTFLKPPTAVIGPEANIIYPSASARVDYEGELAVIISKIAWRVSKENVNDYILGYSCFNDVTARDLQQQDNQWTRAKGFDTFAAIGPWIETDLEPGSLNLETYLNDELKQQGNTGDLIYNIAEIINFISNVMTLMPGDVIATGTPAGIGPMYPGDRVEVKIQGIGSLVNYVIANGNDISIAD